MAKLAFNSAQEAVGADALRSSISLDLLLEKGTAAVQRGELAEALRHVDRVWRQAPDNLSIALLLGHVLIARGEHDAALRHFAKLAERQSHPDVEVGFIEAALHCRDIAAASARLHKALQRFAVVVNGRLANVARQLIAVPSCGMAGWFGIGPELSIVGEVIGISASAGIEIRNDDGTVIRKESLVVRPDGAAEFAFSRLEAATPTNLTAWVGSTSLIGSGLAYPPDFRLDGRADAASGKVTGWASLGWLQDHPIELVAEDEKRNRIRLANQPDPMVPSRQSFAFDAGERGLSGNKIFISARLPDNNTALLPDAPLLLDVSPAAPPRCRSSVRTAERRGVDIIVPVYRGCEETAACLAALIDTARDRAELIAIDDGSPDQDLVAMLDRLAADGSITLLRNDTNRGFPATANRGISLHDDRDVILLNSDAVVHGDWVERLREAAYSAVDIGTVTPLTNTGSIASYPAGTEQDCAADEAARIDALAATVNRGLTAELPVGVGFCLYIRRDCLAEIGLLDAETFAWGYGEEVDFCLRAAMRGWRHVLAADVFIRHAGGRSFGSRRHALLDRSTRIIDLRYPEFQRRIDEFHAADKVALVRRRLDEARLVAAPGPYVVLLTLALTGGVERCVRERAQSLRQMRLRPLIIKPVEPGASAVMLATDDNAPNDLRYEIPGELLNLKGLLARIDIAFFELHHFIDNDPRLVEAMIGFSAPLDIYIHDYSWVCPQLNLTDDTHRYCGEPVVATCELCLAKNGSSVGAVTTVTALRLRSQKWLAAARRVIVPSRDVAQRLKGYFPGIRFVVTPWETDIAPRATPVPQPGTTRVALIGAIGVHKGYEILLACARDAAMRQLPLEFVIIGYSADDAALFATGKVFITGRYAEDEVEELLAREAPHILFFPSVCPETWCYALTYALRSGLPVLGFDLGAIGERLRAHPNGIVLPVTENPARLNDLVMKMTRQHGIKVLSQRARSLPKTTPSAPSRTISSTIDSRSVLMPPSNPVNATVQILPLSKGLYSFSVKAATPTRVDQLQNLLLPAVHVGVGPGVSANMVEFIAAGDSQGSWLSEPGDIIVAKLSNPAILLLTSLPSPGGQTLAIEVEKLNNQAVSADRPPTPHPFAASEQQSQVVSAAIPASDATVPVRINLHIRNQGDAGFVNADWAGRAGRGKWIEAMSLSPLSQLQASDIEYKGLTATGVETPWITNGAECGTRGKATPLLGFAVRLRPGSVQARFECTYSGCFASGKVVGPMTNGAPCRSSLKNDPLEGVQIRFVERSGAAAAANRSPEPAVTGPRFGKLRESEATLEKASASTRHLQTAVAKTPAQKARNISKRARLTKVSARPGAEEGAREAVVAASSAEGSALDLSAPQRLETMRPVTAGDIAKSAAVSEYPASGLEGGGE